MLPDHIARGSKIQIRINRNKIQTIPGALSSSCDIPVMLNQPFTVNCSKCASLCLLRLILIEMRTLLVLGKSASSIPIH